ncbi:MAG: hypothetical protein QXG73_01685 [Candidatus Micrarchaeaceae archaeon]
MTDALDLKIVETLFHDRKPSRIAKLCGISKGTLRNRLKAMTKSGLLLGYEPRARFKQLGMEDVFVGLDIAPESYMDTLETLKRLDFVKELYLTSGDHSAIARIIVRRDELAQRLKEIEGTNGVRHAYPAVVNEIAK